MSKRACGYITNQLLYNVDQVFAQMPVKRVMTSRQMQKN